MGLAFKATATIDWTFERANDISTPVDSDTLRLITALTDGTSTDEVNQMFLDRRLVSRASGADPIDLAGSLSNSFGETVTFSAIKALLIKNRGAPDEGSDPATWTVTDGQDIKVGGAASGAWRSLFNGVASSVLIVPAGGLLLLTAPTSGLIVGPGTHDILQIEYDGDPVSGSHIEYDIVIAGVQ